MSLRSNLKGIGMDWFERLTGFREGAYGETRDRLAVDGQRLTSRVNGKMFAIGSLELVSLAGLRERVRSGNRGRGRLRVSLVNGDVRALHQDPANAGALFQVASQFNLLEMVSQDVTPEDGVTIYQGDPTQGPACAIAAGAATIYRNYFAPVDGIAGQVRDRQLDGLADLGAALERATGRSVASLWGMRNGYALCKHEGLAAISRALVSSSNEEVDQLRGLLRIGVHSDVEVTDSPRSPGPTVSQAFCSALPVAYTRIPSIEWTAFASLVLEAAYEATILAAVLNARRGASNVVLLTRLGGGVFGNEESWIHAAMERALRLASDFDLEVRIVSRGSPSATMERLAASFAK
ncbi:hypothetical protein [Variovorax saccharolyticus]|uniref:hypothetical protein n=1 Tax=Variovorax saccharolyticus TaxID=3053516 RepID=UPI002575F02D|nr:hypothetical protein [Variovorax sp. J22R187]MDM0022172.1 hypothetical protein [Variovorax sp. J22R187]